jgi:hypothetical protein
MSRIDAEGEVLVSFVAHHMSFSPFPFVNVFFPNHREGVSGGIDPSFPNRLSPRQAGPLPIVTKRRPRSWSLVLMQTNPRLTKIMSVHVLVAAPEPTIWASVIFRS